MNYWKQLPFMAVVAISIPVGTSALGQINEQEDYQKNTGVSPRTEQIRMHENLAKVHKQTASCLRSGKTLDQCNQQMKENCSKVSSGQCVGMTEAELQKHRKTHEMAGSIGVEEPEDLNVMPKVK